MQEKVTAKNGEGLRTSDIIVQYNPELQSVGLGLEPQKETSTPGQFHFIDAIYGYDEILVKIGHNLSARLKQEHDLDVHSGYRGSNAEVTLDKELGRFVLDAVTASSSDASLWTWLDRPAVNRLIRLLRKARDFSFGKDE